MIDLNKLNKEQKEAVVFDQGPLLIVAGAGTGKTTVITQRIAYLIGQGKCRPEEILAMTFTDKAANEMAERVDELLEIGYSDLWISTFHAFAERVLRQDGLDIGLNTDFKLQDETASWLLMRQNLDKFKLDYYRPLGSPSKFLKALLDHFSRCKDQGIYPDDYLKLAENIKSNLTDLPEDQEKERIKEVAGAYHLYQKLLLDNNLLDFGDLINYCLMLFQKRPAILAKYQKQFKYILVDEFQDTNFAQYQLVKILAEKNQNLTVCADDFQAIYKFRGASFGNIIQFKKDFPKVKEISLKQNYRSSQNILDLAYEFIKDNEPDRLKYFPNVEKKLISQLKETGLIEHLHFKNIDEEAQGMANKIIALKNNDPKVSLNDFAILVRANDSANPFVRALQRASVPYQFLASRGLYQKPIILDIISYLKLLDNYHESSAVYRLLNLPFLAIDHQEIVQITRYSHRKKSKSIYEALGELSFIPSLSKATVDKINKLLALIKKQTLQVKEKNVSQVLLDFLKDSGYLKHLVKKEDRDALNSLNQFFGKLRDFESQSIDPILSNFMEQFNWELESGEKGRIDFDPDEGPEVVQIMTIHAAKGLEFKYIFLASMVDRRFPSSDRQEAIEIPEELIKDIKPEGDIHLQEERRLCYVAMTRAKQGLFFTSADDYGGKQVKKLSRFLSEMGFKKPSASQKIKSEKLAKTPQETNAFYQNLLPLAFSFSQIKPFQECPLKYKFAHILQIPLDGKPFFSFGSTIHNTLYQFIKQAQEPKISQQQADLFGQIKPNQPTIQDKAKPSIPSLEQLLAIYQQEWLDEWYESQSQKDGYKKQGKKLLKDFYQEYITSPPQIAKINNQLALEISFNFKLGRHTLRGRIDRIDQLPEGQRIVDYKTGQAKEKLELSDKEQLLLYQIASEEALGLKPVELVYDYLEGGKKLSFLGSQKEKIALKQKISQTIEQIKQSDFPPTPGWHCQTCDYRSICQYAK